MRVLTERCRWMSELEKIQAKAKGLRFMDMFVVSCHQMNLPNTDGFISTDTPGLGFSSYLLPSAANIKYCKCIDQLHISVIIDGVFIQPHSVSYPGQPLRDDKFYYRGA